MCLCVQGSREAVIWMAVHHQQKKALEVFSREVAPAGTGAGTTHTLSSNVFMIQGKEF